MLRAFSYLYWGFVIVTMPIFFLVALVILGVTWPFDRRRVALHLFSCFWGSFYVHANPLWRVTVRGRSNIPWRGAAVIVANHQSIVDILILYDIYRPFKWVAKAELFRIPIIGWNLKLNDCVKLARGSRESIREMMQHCRRLLRAGCPIFIFPEGTRTATGELLPFKNGAFRIAMRERVPVIPVALRGTYASMPKSGVVLRQRMDAQIDVLEPLDPGDFADADALRDAAHQAIFRVLHGAPAAGARARI